MLHFTSRKFIIPPQTIEQVNEVLDHSNNWKYYVRQQNLFFVKMLASNYLPRHITLDIKVRFEEEFKLPITGFYCVEYTENSFCILHADADSEVTTITNLKTENLEGGETLIHLNHTINKEDILGQLYRPIKNAFEDQKINSIPCIVDIKPNETIWYDYRQVHGVGLVKKGMRRVLVTWHQQHSTV